VPVRVLCEKYLKKSYPDFDGSFGGGGRSPRYNRLDFGGDPDHNPHPSFLHADHDRDPGIKKKDSQVIFGEVNQGTID